eukprot:CAMPEP_0113944086 /NCGR_PEP_ID=MMETSP1339-20121228/30630_1 /TAXON_ID=94617 /ORGANISM="Fibrocapsa japonica" /LENGTH=73 /DNA_ID=CAMNT_0000949155 /DNA_START=186 /DNA_END=407 /DNA_ORIENTATION=- /assembly_acc=CAM_ASM_000762
MSYWSVLPKALSMKVDDWDKKLLNSALSISARACSLASRGFLTTSRSQFMNRGGEVLPTGVAGFLGLAMGDTA